VAERFRADDALHGAYLVALSGYAQPEDAQTALQAGFDCHVAKPLGPDQLDRLLADLPAPA
jgi:two-component system CheB/CheR fusion protein